MHCRTAGVLHLMNTPWVALRADPGLLGDEGRHRHSDEGTCPEAAGRERHPRQLCGSGPSLVSRPQQSDLHTAAVSIVGSAGCMCHLRYG
jgi:hypothetical protein